MKLVGDGFVLLVMGQVVVFLFIGLMVLFINLTAIFVKRFLSGGEVDEFPETVRAEPEDESFAIAAAAVAVQHLRSNP